MKRILVLILLSALLLCSGCTAANKPKGSLLPHCLGRVIIEENSFDAEMNFEGSKKIIILKAQTNAFDTVYTFQKDKVILQYDDIVTTLEQDALPDTNTAAILYKMMSALLADKVHWEKSGAQYHFSSKINNVHFSGECDNAGNILSLEAPDYQLYFKAV